MSSQEYINGSLICDGVRYETRTFLVDCFGWGREYFHDGGWLPVVITDQHYLCGTVFRRPAAAEILSFSDWKRELRAENKAMGHPSFRYPDGAEWELYEIYLKHQPANDGQSEAAECRICGRPVAPWKDEYGDIVDDECRQCDQKREEGMFNDRDMECRG